MITLGMKRLITALSPLGFLALASQAFAQITPGPTFVISPPAGRGLPPGTDLGVIVNNAIIIIFSVAALLVLVMLVIGAIQWILSGGDKDAVGNARKRITNALIGLAILALAFLIATTVGRIVGFGDVFTIKLPSLGQTQ